MGKIIILGDINLDIILSGMQEFPACGKEIVAGSHAMKIGGSASNVAMVLAMCGQPVQLFGQLGNDEAAKFILAKLKRLGVATHTISRSKSHPTGITVSLSYSRDRMLINCLGTVAFTGIEDIINGYMQRNCHLHLTSYFLQTGLKPSVGLLLKRAKALGMTTSLDPGHDPDEKWSMDDLNPYLTYLDWFLPNADEMVSVTGSKSIPEALERFSTEVSGIVVKAGAQGAFSRYQDAIEHHTAFPAEVLDTTCAGDCFVAAFLFRIFNGDSLEKAVEWGNRFGALASSTLGLPSKNAIRKEIKG